MKEQKGITLIALIITIIVMLILVAVAVTAAVQSNLFGHAGNAARGWKEKEQEEMDIDNRVETTVNGTNVTGIDNVVDAYTNTNRT